MKSTIYIILILSIWSCSHRDKKVLYPNSAYVPDTTHKDTPIVVTPKIIEAKGTITVNGKSEFKISKVLMEDDNTIQVQSSGRTMYLDFNTEGLVDGTYYTKEFPDGKEKYVLVKYLANGEVYIMDDNSKIVITSETDSNTGKVYHVITMENIEADATVTTNSSIQVSMTATF